MSDRSSSFSSTCSSLTMSITSDTSTTSPISLSSSRSPRCLTPYPHHDFFPQSNCPSPSPLVSPVETEGEIPIILSPSEDDYEHLLPDSRGGKTAVPNEKGSPDITSSPASTSQISRFVSLIPPELRMSPMTGTSPTEIAVLPLSPMRRRANTVPSSLEAYRRKMGSGKDQVELRKESARGRGKPLPILKPILVLHYHHSHHNHGMQPIRLAPETNVQLSPIRMTPQGPTLRTMSESPGARREYFKTPGSEGSGGKTALPLTSRRIGRTRQDVAKDSKAVVGEVPVLALDRSPGWADFDSASSA